MKLRKPLLDPCFHQVPNLAGLARTCEIFAASRLVVPDLRVVKHPSFTKISTGAEQWLPIEQLGEKQLLAWIRKGKRQGYTLIGLEQTNNSVCLTKVRPLQLVLLVVRVIIRRVLHWCHPACRPSFCIHSYQYLLWRNGTLTISAHPAVCTLMADEIPQTMHPGSWARVFWSTARGNQRDGFLLPNPAARRAAFSQRTR